MNDQIEGTSPSPLLNPDALSRFLVHDRREILRLMNDLVDKRVLVTVHLGRGVSFISAMLAVTADNGGIILDASPDEPLNGRATVAEEVVCSTALDRIKIQFAVGGVERFPHDGYLALRAPLPESVLRLQRREYFRLVPPTSDQLTCHVSVDAEPGRKKSVALRVLDISSGGLAVVVPPEEITFAPGTLLEDCRLALPETDPIGVRLKVRNLFQEDRENGTRVLRAGCEFMDLSSKDMARIQRYIFKVERDRKAREAGYQ